MPPTDIASALVTAIFLSVVANRLVEGLIVPLFDHFGWDKFALLYVSWIVAGLIVLASGVNLFGAYLPSPVLGQVLTALVAGGGANFIADLFNNAPRPSSTPTPTPPAA